MLIGFSSYLKLFVSVCWKWILVSSDKVLYTSSVTAGNKNMKNFKCIKLKLCCCCCCCNTVVVKAWMNQEWQQQIFLYLQTHTYIWICMILYICRYSVISVQQNKFVHIKKWNKIPRIIWENMKTELKNRKYK